MRRAPPARYVIAIGSGKGGVGKSTIALNLALALRDHGPTGMLDADLYGPNIPLMVGLTRKTWTHDWTLARNRPADQQPVLEPIERYGLQIMSAGFILGEDQPMGIPAETIRFLVSQLLHRVLWGELSYLVVDLPPGTADVLRAVLVETRISGAVLVVTPQDVAHLDARKALRLFEHAKVPILGGIENMSGMVCPHCGHLIDVLPRVPEARAIWSLGVERLGRVPLDPEISRGGDLGTPLLVARPDTPAAASLRAIAQRVVERLSPHSA